MEINAGDALKDAVTSNQFQIQHDGRGRYPPVSFMDLLGKRMTYPARLGTQPGTFVDELLASLDDIEVGQRPLQSVPAKLTPPRSDGAIAKSVTVTNDTTRARVPMTRTAHLGMR